MSKRFSVLVVFAFLATFTIVGFAEESTAPVHDGVLTPPQVEAGTVRRRIVEDGQAVTPSPKKDVAPKNVVSDAVFAHYRKTLNMLVSKLEKLEDDLNGLEIKGKKESPDKAVTDSLMMTLRKLQKARANINGRKKLVDPKITDPKDNLTLMAEGLVNMQMEDLMATYAIDLVKQTRAVSPDGVAIPQDKKSRDRVLGLAMYGAAKEFSGSVNKLAKIDHGDWVFADQSVMTLSPSGKMNQVLADELLPEKETTDTLIGRVKFFNGWGKELLKTDSGELKDYRDTMEKTKAEYKRMTDEIKRLGEKPGTN